MQPRVEEIPRMAAPLARRVSNSLRSDWKVMSCGYLGVLLLTGFISASVPFKFIIDEIKMSAGLGEA